MNKYKERGINIKDLHTLKVFELLRVEMITVDEADELLTYLRYKDDNWFKQLIRALFY